MTKIDLYDAGEDGFYPADATHEATLRVDSVVWVAYQAAVEHLNDVTEQLEREAQRPVYVTPDQEASIRAIAKRGAWIVVKELQPALIEAQAVVAYPEGGGNAEPIPPAPQVIPASDGTPPRPPIGRCAQRGNLPHTPMRYIVTDGASVYFPGRVRVDGLCQCGERLADIRCPHMKQELNERTHAPMCKWCRQDLVGGAGIVDNRRGAGSTMIGGGARDPSVALQVSPDVNLDAKDQKAIAGAYRAPGS